MSNPFDDPPLGLGPDSSVIQRLLAGLMPDALGTESGDVQYEELGAWAALLFAIAERTEAAKRNIFPDRADELLDEWEASLGLTNDAARTEAQRQARVLAAFLAAAGADEESVEAALGVFDPTVAIQRNRADAIPYQGAYSRALFQVAVELATTVFDSRESRLSIADTLRRLVPAQKWFQSGVHDAEDALFDRTGDPTWGGAGVFDRGVMPFIDALNTPYSATPTKGPQVGSATARIIEYSSFSKLRFADMNRLQDSLLIRPARGAGVAFAYNGTGGGQTTIVWDMSIVSGTTATVDSSIDWRERYLMTALSFSAADIRPGSAGDIGIGLTSVARATSLVWTGPGDLPAGFAAGYSWTFAAGLDIFVDSGTGALRIHNSSGGTRYVVGWVSGSEVASNAGGPVSPRLVDFADGDTYAALNKSFVDTLRAKTRTRQALGAGVSVWAQYQGDGGQHRCFLVAIDADETKVVDSECDWRDRVILVATTGAFKPDWSLTFDGPIPPGHPDDVRYMHAGEGFPTSPTASTPIPDVWIGYTGLGKTDAASGAYETVINPTIVFTRNDSTIDISADDVTGHLKVRTIVSGDGPRWLLIMVYATEQIGQRSTPTALEVLTVADSTPIHPAVLNDLQDRAVLAPVQTGAAATDAISEANPLGPLLSPGSGVALPEIVRMPRLGLVRHQPPGETMSCFFYAANPGTPTILDARDWRDRVIWGVGRLSPVGANDLIGGLDTDDNLHNAADTWASCRYVGPGSELLNPPYDELDRGLIIQSGGSGRAWIVVDDDDGTLRLITNAGSSISHVTGWVVSSFKIGGH